MDFLFSNAIAYSRHLILYSLLSMVLLQKFFERYNGE